MNDKQFTITREFDASRDVVWRAWTQPDLAARWWCPSGFSVKPGSVSIDLNVGGRYAYTMVSGDGQEFPMGGEYLEVRQPERLRFTWGGPSGDEPLPEITVDLAEADGRTQMTFLVLGHADDRGASDSIHDGWSQAFDGLDDVLTLGV